MSCCFLLIATGLAAQSFTPSFGCVFDAKKKTKKWDFFITRGESFPLALSDRPKFSNVGDQGDYATCVGWSSTYYATSLLFADTLSYIEDHFSPLFVYNSIKLPTDNGCQNGAMIRSALEFSKNIGNIKESSFQEGCISDNRSYFPGVQHLKETNPKAYLRYRKEASHYRISNYAEMGPNNFSEKVKKAMNEKKVVLVALNFYESMFYSTYPWNGKLEGTPGGHAMHIVGYNDTLFGGSYQILNSWGLRYGKDGCIYVRYSDMPKILEDSYVVSKGEPEAFDEQVFLRDMTFDLTVKINGKTVEINSKKNKAVSYDWDQFYVPVLHNNLEFLCNYKTRKRYQESNISLSLDYSSNRASYVYVFKETVNDYIEKVFPYGDKADNDYSKELSKRGKSMVFPKKDPMYIRVNAPEPGYPEYNYSKLLVIVSAEPLDENKLNEQLKKRHNDLRSFAYEAFGRKINYTDGVWGLTSDTEARFEINELSNVILPMIIDFKAKGKIKE